MKLKERAKPEAGPAVPAEALLRQVESGVLHPRNETIFESVQRGLLTREQVRRARQAFQDKRRKELLVKHVH